MSQQVFSIIVGVFVCLVIPTLYTAAVVYITRNGLPFAFRWRGFARRADGEEEELT